MILPTWLFPFVLGTLVGYVLALLALYESVVRSPPALQQPWEHDGTVETLLARLDHYDWRWSVLFGGPLVVGVTVGVVWWAIALSMGVSL